MSTFLTIGAVGGCLVLVEHVVMIGWLWRAGALQRGPEE